MERCLIIPRFFLALMIFSLICFLKERAESSVRPRCLCSFILATTVPLNIKCGWLGLDVLQENKTSVACLVGSGLNSNFHWLAHRCMTSRSWFKSFADSAGFFTMEKSMVSSAKNLTLHFIFLSKSLR